MFCSIFYSRLLLYERSLTVLVLQFILTEGFSVLCINNVLYNLIETYLKQYSVRVLQFIFTYSFIKRILCKFFSLFYSRLLLYQRNSTVLVLQFILTEGFLYNGNCIDNVLNILIETLQYNANNTRICFADKENMSTLNLMLG